MGDIVRVFSVPAVKPKPPPLPLPPPPEQPVVPKAFLPPPPPPPQKLVSLEVIGDETSIHEVPNWKWDRLKEPLPPDGELWKRDADGKKTGEPNRSYDEGAFDSEYLEADLQREAVLAADLWFQFVRTVAGFTGQGASAEQFWKASEIGGRAVETIFANLNLSKIGAESVVGSREREAIRKSGKIFEKDDRAEDLKDLRRRPLADERLQRQAEAAIKLSGPLRAIAGSGAGGGTTLPKELVEALMAKRAEPTPPSGAHPQADAYRTMISKGFSNVELYALARKKQIEDEAKKEEQDIAKKYPDPNAPNRGKELRALETTFKDLMARLDREIIALRDYERFVSTTKTTAAAAPIPLPGEPVPMDINGKPEEPTVRLPDGTYLEDVNDPDLTLIKLMFRPGRTISGSELQAWDALYYGGTYFQSAKARASANDPKTIKERIELARQLDRMLRVVDPGVGWRKTPHNIGFLLVTDQFSTALKMAYERVRKVCRKEWVPLVDLMTHDQVYVYFARLVAYEIAEQSYQFPGRYMSVTFGKQTLDDRQRLLGAFCSLERDPSGMLYFSVAHSALADAERRSTDRDRKRYLSVTGRYFSDRYPDEAPVKRATMVGLSKKPIYGALEAQKKAEYAKALERFL